jgi:hypothetical protein
MKNIILIAGLLISSIGFCQYSWTDAVVTLKNGTVLNGEAKIPQVSSGLNIGTEKLRYRSDRQSKKRKFKVHEVESVVFTIDFKERVDGKRIEKTRVDTYVPVLIKEKRKNDLMGFMQKVVVGNVSLYGRTVTQYNGSSIGGVGGAAAPMFIPSWSSHNQLWVKRDGQEAELINQISLLKGFKARAVEYFEDCPSLIEKLQDRELKKSDLKEIVEFYNVDCN